MICIGRPVIWKEAGAGLNSRKDLADAYKQLFKKKGKAGKSFAVDLSGGRRFSKNGYFRLKPGMYVKMLRFY